MGLVPLIAHSVPDDVIAYRGGKPIRADRFLADVAYLASTLPAATHVLNACQDRYHFAVGFAAAVVSNRISLLPSTHPPEVIRQLARFATDPVCLTDDPACDIELPLVRFPEGRAPAAIGWSVPVIPARQPVAYVFTSGSTGCPVAHEKVWGRLVSSVRVSAERLGFTDGRCRAIVATVPPQHMYGFESSVLLPLHGGHALNAERPFYPADVATTLASVPAPRVLISTPVHLRTLIAADVDLPPVELVVSATAPLPDSLAQQVEARFKVQVLEIFGSTETGQIATRRTTQTPEWRLWPGVQIAIRAGQTWVEGGHVAVPTPMGDVLEMTSAGHFLLKGRAADLVNIAGKRSSLAYLNHQLTSIPGVLDGAFFMREPSQASATGVGRLGALVVAPTLDVVTITQRLRERLDAAFLPRPLLMVPEIRRNATGKLPHHVLQTLLGDS